MSLLFPLVFPLNLGVTEIPFFAPSAFVIREERKDSMHVSEDVVLPNMIYRGCFCMQITKNGIHQQMIFEEHAYEWPPAPTNFQNSIRTIKYRTGSTNFR